MEWVIKLEAKSGWGEVEIIEVARIERRVVGLAAKELGLTLAEGKDRKIQTIFGILPSRPLVSAYAPA